MVCVLFFFFFLSIWIRGFVRFTDLCKVPFVFISLIYSLFLSTRVIDRRPCLDCFLASASFGLNWLFFQRHQMEGVFCSLPQRQRGSRGLSLGKGAALQGRVGAPSVPAGPREGWRVSVVSAESGAPSYAKRSGYPVWGLSEFMKTLAVFSSPVVPAVPFLRALLKEKQSTHPASPQRGWPLFHWEWASFYFLVGLAPSQAQEKLVL